MNAIVHFITQCQDPQMSRGTRHVHPALGGCGDAGTRVVGRGYSRLTSVATPPRRRSTRCNVDSFWML